MYNYGYDYGISSGYNSYESSFGILGGILALTGIIWLISIAVGIFMIISQWKVLKKAGKGGWECLIPVYNIVVLIEISELPTWYIALFFLPFANIYALFKVCIELAHKFGKSTGFGVGLALLGAIFFPILAFGKNNIYNGSNNQNIVNTNIQNNSYNQMNPTAFQNQNINENNNINYNNQFNPNVATFNQNTNSQEQNNNVIGLNNQVNSPAQVNTFELSNVVTNQEVNQQPEINVVPAPQPVEMVQLNAVSEPTDNEIPTTIPTPVINQQPEINTLSTPEQNSTVEPQTIEVIQTNDSNNINNQNI